MCEYTTQLLTTEVRVVILSNSIYIYIFLLIMSKYESINN